MVSVSIVILTFTPLSTNIVVFNPNHCYGQLKLWVAGALIFPTQHLSGYVVARTEMNIYQNDCGAISNTRHNNGTGRYRVTL